MASIEEQIEKMYAANLASQTERLEQDRAKAEADLAAQQEKAQKATDANLTRTAVEAQKAAVNNAELYNAAGLSSGARAQARLAQENQLQADLTALRVQQRAADAEAERQRGLLAQEFSSAIREAQAENDLAKAQALYERAQLEEERLLAQRSGGSGSGTGSADDMITAGKLIAQETGDYTMWAEGMRLKGVNITNSQLKQLNGDTTISPEDIPGAMAAVPNKIGTILSGLLPGTGNGKINAPSDTKTPQSEVDKFLSSHMSLEQALRRGITKKEYSAMVRDWNVYDWLNRVDLKDSEYEALEKHFGIG